MSQNISNSKKLIIIKIPVIMSQGLLILPATLNELIPSLFNNNDEFISSRVELSDSQKSSIVYPEGMIPLDFFVVYQGSETLELTAFAQVRDYIFGIYYIINNVRFDKEILICSELPVILPSNAELINENYLEVYLDIGGLIVLSGIDSKLIESWVQYSKDGFFHDASIGIDGIINKNRDKSLRVIGLSENLKICEKKVELGSGCKPPLVPTSANLKDTLANLFRNTKRSSLNPLEGVLIDTKSEVKLSDEQKSSITYPDGFIPLNFFVLSQLLTDNDVFISMSVISFAVKDKRLYGFYYDVTNQQIYDPKFLANTKNPVILDSSAVLTDSKYMEFYFYENNKVLLNGLSYGDDLAASLQYSAGKQYFHSWVFTTGIPYRFYLYNPTFNTTLSKTLRLSCK